MSLRLLIIPLALFLNSCDRSTDPPPNPDPVPPIVETPDEPKGKGTEKGKGKAKSSPKSASPSVASQLDHQWQAIELWEGDTKSPDDTVNSTMIEFKEGKFKYIVDGETQLEADYNILEVNTDPARLTLSFDEGGSKQTINVVFKVSGDQLTFAHPLSSSIGGWPAALDKGAAVVYAICQRK